MEAAGSFWLVRPQQENDMKKHYDKPLTLEELSNRPDEDIDTSDISELDEEFWERAKVSPLQTKPNVSLRLPREVIDFFKAESPK